jgi:hypothetical protein
MREDWWLRNQPPSMNTGMGPKGITFDGCKGMRFFGLGEKEGTTGRSSERRPGRKSVGEAQVWAEKQESQAKFGYMANLEA